jgi:plasmid stability protein
MAQVIVRNLDEGVVKRLKARAKKKGRSLEAEIRDILERESRPKSRSEFKRRLEEFHKKIGNRRHTDSVELLREERDSALGQLLRQSRSPLIAATVGQ